MKGTFPIDKFRELRTPFYYYDTKVLRDTLACIRTEASTIRELFGALCGKGQCQSQSPHYYP